MSHNRTTWPIGGRLLSTRESRYLWLSKAFYYDEDHNIHFSKGKTLRDNRELQKLIIYNAKLDARGKRRALKKASPSV